ncbi:MAG: DoxX family protein [Pseudonocardiaceae bacterium]
MDTMSQRREVKPGSSAAADRRRDIALLLIRAVVGVVFIAHGAQKLFGAFGGPGLAGTAESWAGLGLQPANVFALIGGIAEFGGGLLMLAGLLTPVAALTIVGVMIGAIALVTGAKGFFIQNEGYEYNLVLIVLAVAVAIAGPGRLSLDHGLGLPWARADRGRS